jgi:hypothetical protein
MTTIPNTSPELAKLITRARELDAELTVLDLYDAERSSLGHDYGNGQRFHELSRKRRERDEARRDARIYGASDLELVAPKTMQLSAYARISAKRTKRYSSSREGYRDATALRALSAWRSVKSELDSLDI